MPWDQGRPAFARAFPVAIAFLFAFTAAAALPPRLAADDAAETDSAAVLAGHGLKPVGRVWMLDDELRLRRELIELPKRRERILTIENDLGERIERNRNLWQESQPVLTALRKALAKLPTDDPARPRLQQQIDALTKAATAPAKLGGRAEVRACVVEWIDERNALATALVQIRATIGRLGDLYAQVSQAPGVADAVRRAGDKHRLGPQRSYAADRDKLEEYDRLAFTPFVPVFWQGSQLRLTALIDDRSPVTFTWLDSGGSAILLTSTAAEAAGIAVPADAPREVVSRSGQHRAMAARVEVSRLRLGKCVLERVAVFVLPPEAEDWGCQLSREALSGHSVQLEPEHLRLLIDAG
jgi:hypothetical protein